MALALAACGSDERPVPTPVAEGVSGPLCDLLSTGDDPGAPSTLTGEPAGVALTWIPVVTTFEAAVRASGADLGGVTVLAPTDDAFVAAYDRQELDDILLSRRRARALVEAHVVEDVLSLDQLVEPGEVATATGTRLVVTGTGGQARLGGGARTVCADYAVADAYVHMIDGVLRSIDPLRNATVLLVPTVNGDGRAANTRGNLTGQDLSRDYSLIRQPETFAGDYQPEATFDGHELGNSRAGDLPVLPPRHLNLARSIFDESRSMIESRAAVGADGELAGHDQARLARRRLVAMHVAVDQRCGPWPPPCPCSAAAGSR